MEWLEVFKTHKCVFYLKDLIGHWSRQRKESVNLNIGQSFQAET